jgi:hypothetical protein
VRIRGREYPVILPSIRDARLHVAAVLLTLQVLGQTVLGFRLSIAQILVCLAVGALIESGVAFFKDHLILWPASGLLTGNSTAFILRVPGTLHGQWWSLHGIYIFIGVVALGMATKYLIRWKGRHIFNPSNVALVAAFIVLGPSRTEPLDLWWIPMGPWMIVTYAILIGGGVFIGWRLGLLGLEIAFMASFAIFVAIALAPVPDHCMVASWHLSPLCGRSLWEILVTSPEILIFALFMIPRPQDRPGRQGGTDRVRRHGGAVRGTAAGPDNARVLDQDRDPGRPGHRLLAPIRAQGVHRLPTRRDVPRVVFCGPRLEGAGGDRSLLHPGGLPARGLRALDLQPSTGGGPLRRHNAGRPSRGGDRPCARVLARLVSS